MLVAPGKPQTEYVHLRSKGRLSMLSGQFSHSCLDWLVFSMGFLLLLVSQDLSFQRKWEWYLGFKEYMNGTRDLVMCWRIQKHLNIKYTQKSHYGTCSKIVFFSLKATIYCIKITLFWRKHPCNNIELEIKQTLMLRLNLSPIDELQHCCPQGWWSRAML